MIFLYIVLSILIFVICFKIFIKLKFPFWSVQPVFHIYDLNHWLFPNKVINSSIPFTNKYLKLLDIETFPIKTITNELIVKSTDFIQTHFLRNKIVDYIPTTTDIFNYLNTTIQQSYMSFYSKPLLLQNESSNKSSNKSSIIDREILGVITARPMYVTLNRNSFPIYYIDNLCVHKNNRKQNIAPYLIQTHYYHLRNLNNKINVCLFKREGTMTPIVPLTTYNTFGYYCEHISKQPKYPTNFKLLRITSQNINLFKDFFKQQAIKFKCVIQPELELIIHLIKNENLVMYGLIHNHFLISLYIFRKIPSFIKTKSCFECIASINNTPYNDIFIAGFTSAIRRYSRKYKTNLLFLENTSHNPILNNFLINHNIKHFYSSPHAFFLYNYVSYSIDNNSCLFIY